MDELYNRVVDRMCEAGCSIFYAMAYAQGYVEGYKVGRIITSRECVSALMKNLGMTFEEVVDLLEVEEVAKIIKKEIVEEEA